MKQFSRRAAFLNYCLINTFIVIYFSFSITWLLLTAPKKLRLSGVVASQILSKIKPFAHLTGLQQSWAFFSPNVKGENSYSLLTIKLQNGLIRLVELPRMETLNTFKKMQDEKYRKLFNDNMVQPDYVFMRPDVARFEARAASKSKNMPTRVAFFLISRPTPPPPIAMAADDSKNITQHTPVEKYFVYGVSPNDL